MTKALIVVDVQNDFCEGGSLAVAGGISTAIRIAKLLRGDHGYDHVVATMDLHVDPGDHFSDTPDYVDSWPPHCVANTSGAYLRSEIRGLGLFEEIFQKGAYSAAYSGFEGVGHHTGYTLSNWLYDKGVTDVDVCGIATDYCVKATVLDALEEGFNTRLLWTSYTAAVSVETEQQAIAEMVLAGARVV